MTEDNNVNNSTGAKHILSAGHLQCDFSWFIKSTF